MASWIAWFSGCNVRPVLRSAMNRAPSEILSRTESAVPAILCSSSTRTISENSGRSR